MEQVKQQSRGRGGGWGSFFVRPKHKNPVPRSFFTPKDRNQTETLATHSSVPIEIVNVIFTLWMDFSCTAIQSFEWSQGGWGSLPPHRWYKQLLGLTCNSRSCLAPIIHSQQDTAVDMEHSVKSSVGHQQMLWSRRRSTTERRCFWYYMFSCNSWFN